MYYEICYQIMLYSQESYTARLWCVPIIDGFEIMEMSQCLNIFNNVLRDLTF
jgi:hypothetical protein